MLACGKDDLYHLRKLFPPQWLIYLFFVCDDSFSGKLSESHDGKSSNCVETELAAWTGIFFYVYFFKFTSIVIYTQSDWQSSTKRFPHHHEKADIETGTSLTCSWNLSLISSGSVLDLTSLRSIIVSSKHKFSNSHYLCKVAGLWTRTAEF